MDVAIMLGGVRVHEPAANVFALSAKLSQQAGSAPTLSLSVAPDHPAASALTSDAAGEVTLTEDGTTTFRGRVTSVDVAIDGTRSVRCEDSLAYLNDTTQRPFKNYETNSVAGKVGAPLRGDDLFAWLVGRHNDLVGEDRRLYVDTNEGSSFGPVPLANNQYPTTRNAIDQMLKASGGYVWTSYRDGRRYVNWTVRGRGRCAQPIEFGTNIVDFTRSLSAGGRTTAIVPTGEALKTGDRAQVLTLSGSAPSLPSRYLQRGDAIYSPDAVARWGWVEEHKSYSGATKPQQLADRAVSDLDVAISGVESVEVSAVDLSWLDPSHQRIGFMDEVRVTSRPHGIDQWMVCVGRELDCCDPSASRYTLGALGSTLVGSVVTSSAPVAVGDVAKRLSALSDADVAGAIDAEEVSAQAAKAAADAAKATEDAGIVIDAYEAGELTPTTVDIVSSAGTVFRSNTGSTTLRVVVRHGPVTCETQEQLAAEFGAGARVEWSYMRGEDETWQAIPASDSRLSDGGMRFAVTADDVDGTLALQADVVAAD